MLGMHLSSQPHSSPWTHHRPIFREESPDLEGFRRFPFEVPAGRQGFYSASCLPGLMSSWCDKAESEHRGSGVGVDGWGPACPCSCSISKCLEFWHCSHPAEPGPADGRPPLSWLWSRGTACCRLRRRATGPGPGAQRLSLWARWPQSKILPLGEAAPPGHPHCHTPAHSGHSMSHKADFPLASDSRGS